MDSMMVSVFSVPRMDCPSEERLIRLALDDASGVAAIEVDLGKRELSVVHDGPVDPIRDRLERLDLGAELTSSMPAACVDQFAARSSEQGSPEREARTLKLLLAINAAMFVVELVTGWLAQSTGLMADSLDMFADAAVYGLALSAVGVGRQRQQRAAELSGWLQLVLAVGALSEVLRRFLLGSQPEPPLMMGIALIALAANVTCLWLISRHRDGGVHMKASWIFSTNDVLANLGVIAAGALVAWTGSPYPDLAIGTVIALLVMNGARRILRLRA